MNESRVKVVEDDPFDIEGIPERKSFCGSCNYCPQNDVVLNGIAETEIAIKAFAGVVVLRGRGGSEVVGPKHRCHSNPAFVCHGSSLMSGKTYEQVKDIVRPMIMRE